MGVKNLSSILAEANQDVIVNITLEDLSDRIVGLDGFNQIYQFLASIRDSVGRSLQDSEGRVTSHLVGLLTRNCSLLQSGIIPVYVFDGKSHPLKSKETERRKEVKRLAEIEYQKALKENDMVKARSFAQRTNKLTSDMLNDSKILLEAMGIPWVQAPGEGEAQAAQMTREGSFWATASQDYDALLFGSGKLVRNLNISGKRNLPGGKVIEIRPEVIELQSLLDALEITRSQLIDLGILLGSDFNPDGFKGVGVKTAYKWIREYGDFETIQKNEKKVQEVEVEYEEIREIFNNPSVTQGIEVDYSRNFDPAKIIDFLVNQRGFSEARYGALIEKTATVIEEKQLQGSLDDWF